MKAGPKAEGMTPLELALTYMDCVFTSGNLGQLRIILADHLKFRGPLLEFDNADNYVKSLRNDPPDGFDYELIKTYEDNTSACLVYRFSKPGVDAVMSQLFEVENEKIVSILLVFDASLFRKS